MPRDFLNISSEECLDSYKAILENSNRHHNIGIDLAKNGEYGIAISHLVLGSEELVKALIIYFDGIGLNIRGVKGVKKFFRDHKSRHVLSAIFIFMVKTLRPIMKIVNRFFQLIHVPESRTDMNDFEKAFLDLDKEKVENSVNNWLKTEGEVMSEDIMSSLDFWSDADKYKLRGFYVDYDSQLLSPKDVTLDEYLRALNTINLFRLECLNLINYAESLPIEAQQELVTMIDKDDQFYNTIKKLIDQQNKPRK